MKRGHKNARVDLTAEEVRCRFEYDPKTGKFYSRGAVPRHYKAGHEIGWVSKHAFGQRIKISIDGVHYMAHRLAVLYMTGEWPEFEVDHIDGDGLNNRWNNLRQATSSQNEVNRPLQKNNKTGEKGVCFDNRRKKFLATVKHMGKQMHVGHFNTIEEAAAARKCVVNKLYGKFYRHY